MEQINLNCFYEFKFLCFLLLLLFTVNKQCLTSQAALSAATPRSSIIMGSFLCAVLRIRKENQGEFPGQKPR